MKQSGLNVRITRVWLALTLGLVPAGLTLAQGTIVYHQPAVPLSPLIGQELDINGDGQLDVRFYDGSYSGGSFYGTAASGVGTARLLVTPQGPNDFGSYLVGLNQGFLIGGSMSPSLFWAAHDAPNLYGDATVLGFYIPEEGSNVIPDGYFYGTTAYMGIQFEIGTAWHYGWMRVRGEEWFSPGAAVLDWAYDTRPNTPIFAGAVPEPSVLALFTVAGIALLTLRQR